MFHWLAMFLCSGFLLLVHLGFAIPVERLDRESEQTSLRVLTANLAHYSPALMLSVLRFNQPDLIAFQEVRAGGVVPLINAANRQLRRLEDKRLQQPWTLDCQGNLCLASRLPIRFIESQTRRFRGGWGLMGALYEVDVNGEYLRVVNVHLETPRKGIEDMNLRRLDVEALRHNARNRRLEAELLSGWAGEQAPMVLLGDFNMPTGESLYRDHFARFRNAFSEVGFGFGHTKFTTWLSVRIDHVLSSEDVVPISARVVMDVGSDHRPLLVDLALGL